MGSTDLTGSLIPVEFRSEAPFPFPVQTRLLRNGEVVQSAEGTKIAFLSEKPGVYRLEIYLQGGLSWPGFPLDHLQSYLYKRGWIVKTPFWTRQKSSA